MQVGLRDETPVVLPMLVRMQLVLILQKQVPDWARVLEVGNVLVDTHAVIFLWI